MLLTMVFKDVYSIMKEEPWKTLRVNFEYISDYLDYLYKGETEIKNDPSTLLLRFLDDINKDFSDNYNKYINSCYHPFHSFQKF